MVAKACRCLPCRQRKVKCDQAWPQCGQCERGRRKCPGPPASVKFMWNETSWPSSRPRTKSKSLVNRPSAAILSSLSDDSYIEFLMPMSVSMSGISTSKVASALVHAMQADGAPFNPSNLGTFVKHVPCMLDFSPSLTATVACCLDACNRNTQLPKTASRQLDPVLYGRALAEIHAALDDPEQRLLDSTFFAVVLLQRIWTVLATRKVPQVPCWSVHAGGLSELLKFRGVIDPDNDVVFDTFLENFGPIVSHSFMRGEDCFMTAPEWQTLLKERPAKSLEEGLLARIFALGAFQPRLVGYVQAWRRGEDCRSQAKDLAISMWSELRRIGEKLDKFTVPTLKAQATSTLHPVGTIYCDVPRQAARVVCWHALASIMISNILMQLCKGDDDERIWSAAKIESQNRMLSRRAWMMSEEARSHGLMRFYYYPGPLLISYDSADSDGTRRWIVDLMNDVLSGTVAEYQWTHATIQHACDAMCARTGGSMPLKVDS